MEKAFYHPERGVWHTTHEPPEDILDAYPEGTVEIPVRPGENFVWDGEKWAPSGPPAPVAPETISDRQFFQALANRQLITKAEALAAVSVGTLPAAMDALLAGMSEDDEFAARMLLQGATQFNRSHPLTQAFGAGFGMTPTQIDELWIEAEAL